MKQLCKSLLAVGLGLKLAIGHAFAILGGLLGAVAGLVASPVVAVVATAVGVAATVATVVLLVHGGGESAPQSSVPTEAQSPGRATDAQPKQPTPSPQPKDDNDDDSCLLPQQLSPLR